jgi:hypothetical protein
VRAVAAAVALALGAGTAAPAAAQTAMPQLSGNWTYTERKDRFTDERDYLAIARAAEDDDFGIMLHCDGPNRYFTSIFRQGDFPYPLDDPGIALIRLDRDPAIKAEFRRFSSSEIVLAPETGQNLWKALFAHQTMAVRLESPDNHRHEYTIRLQGAGAVRAFFKAKCRID